MIDTLIPPFETKIPIDIYKIDPELTMICIHRDTVFLFYEKLYFIDLKTQLLVDTIDIKWSSHPFVPFTIRKGQTMTSTSIGLIFFGGIGLGDNYYNDIWVFNEKDWLCIPNNIEPRAYHSACFDGRNTLIISGGISREKQHFTDFNLVNIRTGAVQTISNPIPIPLSRHSITRINRNTLCVLGGETTNQKPNGEIFMINMETWEYRRMQTEYQGALFKSPSTFYYLDMLFVTGGFKDGSQTSEVWVYNFTHKVWFPLHYPQLLNPVIAFVSKKFSQNKSIHILDSNFSRLITTPVFAEPPAENYKNHPFYISFLKNHLSAAIPYFKECNQKFIKQYKTIKREADKLSNDLGVSVARDDSRMEKKVKDSQIREKRIDQLYSILEKINQIGSTIDTIQIPNEPEKTSRYQNVHELCTSVQHYRAANHTDVNTLQQKAYKLSNKIESLTFYLKAKDPLPIEIDQNAFETALLKSQQLAQMIALRQEEKSELDSLFKNASETHIHKQDLLLNIMDQLNTLRLKKIEVKKKLIETQNAYYANYAKYMKNRISILGHKEHDLSSIEYQNSKKEDLLLQLSMAITDLINSRPGESLERAEKAMKVIDEFSEWATESDQLSAGIKIADSEIVTQDTWEAFITDYNDTLTEISHLIKTI